MIGLNHPSARNLGYEITKKLLTTFSPSPMSFEPTLRALGAKISRSSKSFAFVIAFGRMDTVVGSLLFFFLKKSNMFILF